MKFLIFPRYDPNSGFVSTLGRPLNYLKFKSQRAGLCAGTKQKLAAASAEHMHAWNICLEHMFNARGKGAPTCRGSQVDEILNTEQTDGNQSMKKRSVFI